MRRVISVPTAGTLGRTLLYGRLEDEKSFNTVRRLVQYEDYMLPADAGRVAPVPEPYGIVEITPEREYLLVTEFFDGAVEIGDVQVDDDLIDQGLEIGGGSGMPGPRAATSSRRTSWCGRAGCCRSTRRSASFGRARGGKRSICGSMLLVLALRSDPRQVYQRALAVFTVDEITEAFAATRGLTMPSQLRRLMRAQGRDLHAEFVALLPAPPRPIRIQRWSIRRVGLIALSRSSPRASSPDASGSALGLAGSSAARRRRAG